MIIRRDPGAPGADPVRVQPSDAYMRLTDRLESERRRKAVLVPYREGRPPLCGIRSDLLTNMEDTVERKQAADFLLMSRLNLCNLIVDAVTDDMAIDSFTDLTAPAEIPDPQAAETAEGEEPSIAPSAGGDVTTAAPSVSETDGGYPASSLEAQSRYRRQHGPSVLKRFAADVFHYGEGFLLVDAEGVVKYVPSDCAIVITDDLDPWNRLAAAVRLTDALGEEYMEVFIRSADGRVYEFRASQTGIVPVGGADGLTPFSRIPVVSAATPDGKGVYEAHLSTIDRINFSIYERIVLMDKQAFRELWVKGLPAFYEDPETGERIPIDWSKVLLKGPGNANLLPGDSTDVEETGEADFTQITSAVLSDVKYLAAVTSTPLYILDPSAAQESALGADKADKVHRTRIRTLRVAVGEAFAEAMALSFEATGERGKEFEAVWAPLEDETISQRAQSATLLGDILPQRYLWTDILQLTPEQVSRAEAGLVEDRINKILDGVAEAKAQQQADEIGAGAEDAGQDVEAEFSAKVLDSAGPELSGDEQSAPGDEETFTGSRTRRSAKANTSAAFLVSYLQQHGGEARAKEVQEAARQQGYGASTVKVARTRLGSRVRTVERQEGSTKRRWWILNTTNAS